MKIVFLCHIWLGTHTQLVTTFDKEVCYQNSQAQQIWVEEYNIKDKWQWGRLSAICGWSNQRCPWR